MDRIARWGLSQHNLKRLGLRLAQAAWLGAAGLAIGLSFAGLPARLRELAFDNLPDAISYSVLALELFLALAFFLPALFIASRKPGSLLVLFTALVLICLGATETGMSNAFINPAHNPGGQVWRLPVYMLRAIAMTGALVLLYVFPDGRFRPRFTRWLAVGWVLMNLAWLVRPTLAFNPNDGPTWRATPLLSLLFGITWFATGLLAQVYRYRIVPDTIQRQQTRWTAAGMGAAVLGGVMSYGLLALANAFPLLNSDLRFYIYQLSRTLIETLLMALFPLFVSVAVLRYRLFDIDLLIHRTLVYGSLTVLIAAAYVSSVVISEQLLGSGAGIWASLPATILVAIAFQPLRLRLQRAASRLVYGQRDDPYAAISGLGQRLESALAPSDVLPAVVETVAQALKLPFAAIYVSQQGEDAPAAQFPNGAQPPARDSEWVTLPITHAGETIGRLELAPRLPGEPFSPADVRLLADLARAASGAVHARLLTGQLQAARERLVFAREEERRRLRQDLHDDIGPALASLTYRLGIARRLLDEQPGKAALLLDESVENVQSMVGEVRRLVDGLRPPDLDELGLLPALKQAGANLVGDLQLHFDTPQDLPPLPAAVESAVYRIVMEALTNVLRHADARCAWVRIKIQAGELHLEVQDDGRGLVKGASHDARRGVGLHSMRERAEELGGSLEVAAPPSGGTSIRASIPLQLKAAQ